jgi:hypothetical protein
MAWAMVLLPEPDWPTRPTVVARATSNDTPRTASTVRLRPVR